MTDADRERKYFMAHVEPGAEYRIDLTGLSVDLDLYYKGSDATFLRDPLARSTNHDDYEIGSLAAGATFRYAGWTTAAISTSISTRYGFLMQGNREPYQVMAAL